MLVLRTLDGVQPLHGSVEHELTIGLHGIDVEAGVQHAGGRAVDEQGETHHASDKEVNLLAMCVRNGIVQMHLITHTSRVARTRINTYKHTYIYIIYKNKSE